MSLTGRRINYEMITPSKVLAVLAATIFLPMLVAPIHATTLYDSGTGSQTPPQAGVSLTGGVVDANRFILSNPASLSSVSFYILECCNLTWSGTINYYLFTNSGSQPASAPFAQGTTASYLRNTIYSDGATNVVAKIDFNLTTPAALSASTFYWLGIGLSNGGSGPTWNAVVPISGISATSNGGTFNNWAFQGQTGAFALFDTTFQTTPEPESALMLLGGLGLIGLARLRRRKRAIPRD